MVVPYILLCIKQHKDSVSKIENKHILDFCMWGIINWWISSSVAHISRSNKSEVFQKRAEISINSEKRVKETNPT